MKSMEHKSCIATFISAVADDGNTVDSGPDGLGGPPQCVKT